MLSSPAHSLRYICRQCLVKHSFPHRAFHSSKILRNVLSAGILRQAHAIRDEHASLNKQLEANYEIKLARRLGELSAVTKALQEYEEATNNLSELRSMLNDETLDQELRSLAEEDIEPTTAAVAEHGKELHRALVPKHRFAHLPALVEIRPGTGGSEAAIFVLDLWKMYMAFCSLRGWPVNIVSVSETEGGDGIVEGIFEIAVDGAYDEMRVEAGVHRVQRIPATETKGRVHTSTATIMVLPSFPVTEVEGEEDPDGIIDMKDVRVDIMRARGAGGQHVNTTDSAVRMTHIPTGTVAAIQDSRSQHKNREKCLSVLKSRIAEKRRAEREAEELRMRRGAAKVGAGRSDKMRTYNYSQNRVTDHRPGFSLHDLPACMKGEDLGKLIEEVKKWQMERDVENMAEV